MTEIRDKALAIDFELPDFPEPLREPGSVNLPWDQVVAIFEAQRRAYMRDYDSPEVRLENKVDTIFSLDSEGI